LRKANRQIRSTKRHLGLSDAYGLLLLANDMGSSLFPELIAHILYHSLRNQYSSIEGVIFFSATSKAQIPGIQDPVYYWLQIVIEDRRRLDSEFSQTLEAAWFDKVSAALNQPMCKITIPYRDPELINLLNAIRFVR